MDRTEQARAYIHGIKGKWRVLCADTGLKYDWVMKFSQGYIRHPSARFVDKVLEHRDAARQAA
jgi:hypothetical protein